ncbi:MAG: amidohydrolase [Bacillota bacterium]|nr:amidohydrolase [Candidatus Fermentithermobacillaceae bacterium]
MKATIFTNGNLWAAGRDVRRQSSLAALDGRIIYIGDYAECLDAFPVGSKPEIVDLEGKTVLPGFIDSHIHLLGFALTLRDVPLADTRSIEEIKSRVSERAARTPEDGWILGRGWDQDVFAERRYPTRKDLDEVCGGRPVLLRRACGHIAVASTKALEIAGITRDAQDPPGGAIDRDAYGDPTGILRESAIGLVSSHIPPANPEIMEDLLKQAMEHALSKGLTSIHTNDSQLGFPGTMDLYRKVQAQGVPLRVYWDIHGEYMPDLLETPLRAGDGDDYFRIGAIKLFADGSLGGGTAALEEPYADDPGNTGILVNSEEQLKQQVYLAHANGMQVAIHAIGDRATRVSLEAVNFAQSKLPVNHIRHRLVHVQILSPHLISEMKRARVVADIQPKFISTDMRWALERVGPERMRTSYAWRTMLRAGIPLAGGSDCPVEPLDPLCGIYCAVTRKDMEGNPPAGFFPNERLRLDDAVKVFTMGGAYGAHQEHKKGSLVPGKLCDFVVLSEDIASVSPDDIKDLEVVLTVVGGDIAYRKA